MANLPNINGTLAGPQAGAAALSYAQQVAQGLRQTMGLKTPANIGSYQQWSQGARAYNSSVFPQMGGIPQGPVNLGGLNSTLLNLQKTYGLKIPGSEKGSSSQNLAAILAEANTPLSPAEAHYKSLAFMKSIVQANLKAATSGDNFDAQELAKLEQDIEEIRARGKDS